MKIAWSKNKEFRAFKIDCLQAKLEGKESFIFNYKIFFIEEALNLIKEYEREQNITI